MNKILVPIDGSENAKKALLKAKEIATLKTSDVMVLTVIENIKGNTLNINSADEISRQNGEYAEKILKEALEEFKDYPGVVEADYRVGDVAEKIIDVITEKNIDLVVMGRRGLGTFSRALLGSVSNKILNNVKTSVLIVR